MSADSAAKKAKQTIFVKSTAPSTSSSSAASSNFLADRTVYVGKGFSTQNAPAPTLFVSQVPASTPRRDVEELFAQEPGYIALRTVRHMYFVDFDSVRQSTEAMRKYQGYTGFHVAGKNGQSVVSPQPRAGAAGLTGGILIDFDKDARSKRNKQFERQMHMHPGSQWGAGSNDSGTRIAHLHCQACGHTCFKLALEKPMTFAALPKRKVDGAVVVDTEKYV